jgi:HSP20 family molecular chaperone IbpA
VPASTAWLLRVTASMVPLPGWVDGLVGRLKTHVMPPARPPVQAAQPAVPESLIFVVDRSLMVQTRLPGAKSYDVRIHTSPGELMIVWDRARWVERLRTFRKFIRRIPLPEGAEYWNARHRFEVDTLLVSIPLPAADDADATQGVGPRCRPAARPTARGLIDVSG